MQALAIESPLFWHWGKDSNQRQTDEPSPRRCHSAVIHKSSLYVYGGLLQDKEGEE